MEGEQKKEGISGLMGAIIIIVIIVAGGWYFIGNRVEKIQDQKEAGKVLDVSTGTSTEVADIEADLNNLDLNSLNQ
jgi:hypothetical protein